jgi:hypothetical protein
MFRSKTDCASRAISVVVLLSSVLAGCSDLYFDRRETIAPDGGDSIAANAAEQTINPWPRNSFNNNLAFNGQRMQRAVECYRYNKVAQPADIDPTTEGGTSLLPPPAPATCDTVLQTNNANSASQWNTGGGGIGGALSAAAGSSNK